MSHELVDRRHTLVFEMAEVVKEDELARPMGVGICDAVEKCFRLACRATG